MCESPGDTPAAAQGTVRDSSGDREPWAAALEWDRVTHWGSNVSCSRHYTLDACLPLRLRPESMEKLRCLRACVIRSLYHMYEPFAARISKIPAIPESTPSTLKNSKVSE